MRPAFIIKWIRVSLCIISHALFQVVRDAVLNLLIAGRWLIRRQEWFTSRRGRLGSPLLFIILGKLGVYRTVRRDRRRPLYLGPGCLYGSWHRCWSCRWLWYSARIPHLVVCRQLFQIHVHSPNTIWYWSPTLSSDICRMCYILLYPLESGMKIESTAFPEGQLDLHKRVLLRYATAGSGYENCFPNVGAEERSCDVSILEGEEWRGERLELWSRG